ncbi:MAG: XRE family transcriptional regulator [Synergistales bacterium]|nr:XRE family transcriptional regulator [Synergistales bacterium]
MGCGGVIRKARRDIGMTQGELAQKIGCTRTTVCDWENEKYSPTDAKNLAALEAALGLPNGELYLLIYGNPTVPPADRGPKGKETA